MHEPNCSSLPGSSACRQPWVLPATGVGLAMGRNRPKIRSKGVGQPLALPPSLTLSLALSLTLALTLVLGGQHNTRATTAARRACTCTCRAAGTR